MRVLIFDTETTGLPKSKFIGPDTLYMWPHIVQFSYIIYNTETNELEKVSDYIVKMPHDKSICGESTKIHGITDEMSKNGSEIGSVLTSFFEDIKKVDQIAGHNVEFDINMLKIELLRLINSEEESYDKKTKCKEYLFTITNSKKIFCTMRTSIDFCNIQILDKKGQPYKKFPKLIELHQKLFEETPTRLHNALNDILVTLRCYMKLSQKQDIMETSVEFEKIFRPLLE